MGKRKRIDSHYLSYLLRHHPEEKGLTLDEFGWCSVQELLRALDITKQSLEDLVENNTRYVFNENKTKIKAAHGHSVPIKYTNEEVPPQYLYHGTEMRLEEVIRKEGLKKMSREAVHLSEDFNDAFKIGLRHTGYNHEKVLVFRIRSSEMYSEGFKFYRSEDGVWLVDNVPPRYLEC